jgi:CelD/BcsL family acetyltransferase involved in cellulose biosynthesis
MSETTFKTIKKLDNDFIREWHEFWDKQQNAHFFNSPEWFISCLTAFNAKNYFIFVVYQSKKIKLIWPTVKMKKFGISFLGSPGGEYLDKNSLLFDNDDPTIIGALIEKILKDANIYMTEVDEKTKCNIARTSTTKLIRQSSINPYISLDLEPFRFIKNKQKNEIKNKIKRYQGNLSFKLCEDNLRKHLATIFDIEHASIKAKNGKNIFSKKIARDLFNHISNGQNDALIALLFFNNKPIAHMFGLISKRSFIAYHMAYLKDYKNLIPGKILLYFLLPLLKEKDFTLFDFSRGESILKKQFAQQKKTQYEIFISDNTIINFYISCVFFINNAWLSTKKCIKNLLNIS